MSRQGTSVGLKKVPYVAALAVALALLSACQSAPPPASPLSQVQATRPVPNPVQPARAKRREARCTTELTVARKVVLFRQFAALQAGVGAGAGIGVEPGQGMGADVAQHGLGAGAGGEGEPARVEAKAGRPRLAASAAQCRTGEK